MIEELFLCEFSYYISKILKFTRKTGQVTSHANARESGTHFKEMQLQSQLHAAGHGAKSRKELETLQMQRAQRVDPKQYKQRRQSDEEDEDEQYMHAPKVMGRSSFLNKRRQRSRSHSRDRCGGSAQANGGASVHS